MGQLHHEDEGLLVNVQRQTLRDAAITSAVGGGNVLTLWTDLAMSRNPVISAYTWFHGHFGVGAVDAAAGLCGETEKQVVPVGVQRATMARERRAEGKKNKPQTALGTATIGWHKVVASDGGSPDLTGKAVLECATHLQTHPRLLLGGARGKPLPPLA
jgi:hypothetical protein